jgi:hypothetical protein
MWEIKETSPMSDLDQGHCLVGNVPTPISSQPLKRKNRGVLLHAPGPGDPRGANTDVVYIGGAQVTADRNAGTGGIPLLPGASLEIPIEDPQNLYGVSATAGQDVAWLGI